MEWIEAKSLEELKSVGKFRDIKKKISKEFNNELRISAKSWDDLFNLVLQLKSFKNSKAEGLENQSSQKSEERSSDYIGNSSKKVSIKYIKNKNRIIRKSKNLFFHNTAAEYIFYLIKLDGKSRQEMLKITSFHYKDQGYATKWYRNIAKVIHPDVCKHPYSKEALVELNKIYERMQANEKENYRNRTSS